VGLIPDEIISEIRARADIVSVIGQHVQLKRAGRNWKGLCPFHGEKSPSFNVSPDKGFFYCFGCHKKGDVFTFVMELLGKSFLEAAETLAGQCGVVIPETTHNPEVARARGERATMLAINKLATQFFVETLASPRGAAGRAYLDTRAIGAEQRAAFQLGFAPADWHGLADFLKAKRADLEAAVKVGLIARQPKAGGYYDRFRERVVCPIVLPGNEVAGFSARLVAEAPKDSAVGAKYINSPESPVYKKSRLLFGLAQARDAMRLKGRAVLVEGNFDVISMHQAGFTETVAPLGTALTPEQVELLRRQTNEVILFYDGDRAGRAATRAALGLMLAAEVPVRIAWRSRGDGVRLEGQDPTRSCAAGSTSGPASITPATAWRTTRCSCGTRPATRPPSGGRCSRTWPGWWPTSRTPTGSRWWRRTCRPCSASGPRRSPGPPPAPPGPPARRRGARSTDPQKAPDPRRPRPPHGRLRGRSPSTNSTSSPWWPIIRPC
jgi:DNA primase